MTHPNARKLRSELTATLARLRLLDVQRDEDGLTSPASPDLFDGAQVVEQRELGHLAAARLAERARRLRAALGRIERGEYGICEECGEDISHTRLNALPDVVTCLECQERREQAAM